MKSKVGLSFSQKNHYYNYYNSNSNFKVEPRDRVSCRYNRARTVSGNGNAVRFRKSNLTSRLNLGTDIITITLTLTSRLNLGTENLGTENLGTEQKSPSDGDFSTPSFA